MKYYTNGKLLLINITKKQAETGSHPGDCSIDISNLLFEPNIKKSFDLLKPDDIRAELKPYGAWDDEELQDDEQNKARLLWIVCGDIVEESRQNKRKAGRL